MWNKNKEFKKNMTRKNFAGALSLLIFIGLFTSCGSESINSNNNKTIDDSHATVHTVSTNIGDKTSASDHGQDKEDHGQDEEDQDVNKNELIIKDNQTIEYNGISYQIFQVDGGDLSGSRLPNAAVDVGYGDRTYWAFTNEYGQLVYVIAAKVTLQDDTELKDGKKRYYPDEAKVPGTEREDLDEGHIIADSLGGVSNAYNITPQNSTLNKHGDQAYMEEIIRDAGGCEDFIATITYPDTTTQIPSHYKYEYALNGYPVIDAFDNLDPDEINAAIHNQPSTAKPDMAETSEAAIVPPADTADEQKALIDIDTNGNGQVTIDEAKAAGYTMPLYSDHWLYKYMHDGDGDGMVGEQKY